MTVSRWKPSSPRAVGSLSGPERARHIPAADFRGSPQAYVTQLEATEDLESRWGAHDLTDDDLGEWFTFAFTLPSRSCHRSRSTCPVRSSASLPGSTTMSCPPTQSTGSRRHS